MSDVSVGLRNEDEKQAPKDRDIAGPFDVTEAVDVKPYVDLGGILIPPRPGLEIKLEVEETSKRVVAASLELDGSTLQVQAFAESRAEGIWQSLRQQLIEQISAGGGTYEEVSGPLGIQIESQVPTTGGNPGGRIIYIGVDGPRWFLRGVILGRATQYPVSFNEIISLFRSIVVNRGDSPMPPRDLIQLRIPAPPVTQDIQN